MDRFAVSDADFAARRREKRERPAMSDEDKIAYYRVRWRKKRRVRKRNPATGQKALMWEWKEQVMWRDLALKRVERLQAGKYKWKLIAVLKFTLDDGPSEIEIDRWTAQK